MTRLSAGALVWAGFDGSAIPGPLLDAIERGRIGGLLLFAYRGNIRSREQVRGMLREAVEASRRGGLPTPVRSRARFPRGRWRTCAFTAGN